MIPTHRTPLQRFETPGITLEAENIKVKKWIDHPLYLLLTDPDVQLVTEIINIGHNVKSCVVVLKLCASNKTADGPHTHPMLINNSGNSQLIMGLQSAFSIACTCSNSNRTGKEITRASGANRCGPVIGWWAWSWSIIPLVMVWASHLATHRPQCAHQP